FHSHNRRTRRINTVAGRIPIVAGRSVRAHRESGAPDGGRRPLCRSRAKERSAVAAPLIFTDKVAGDFGASTFGVRLLVRAGRRAAGRRLSGGGGSRLHDSEF